MPSMASAQTAFANRNRRSLNHRARTPPGLQRSSGVPPSHFARFVEDTTAVAEETTTSGGYTTAGVKNVAAAAHRRTNGNLASSSAGTTSARATPSDEADAPLTPPTPTSTPVDNRGGDDRATPSAYWSTDSTAGSNSDDDDDKSAKGDADGSSSDAAMRNFWLHWYIQLAANAERAGMSSQDYHDLLAWNAEVQLVRDRIERDAGYEADAQRIGEELVRAGCEAAGTDRGVGI